MGIWASKKGDDDDDDDYADDDDEDEEERLERNAVIPFEQKTGKKNLQSTLNKKMTFLYFRRHWRKWRDAEEGNSHVLGRGNRCGFRKKWKQSCIFIERLISEYAEDNEEEDMLRMAIAMSLEEQ